MSGNHWLKRDAVSVVFLVLPNTRLTQQKATHTDWLTQVLLIKMFPPRYELMLCLQLVSRLGTKNGHSKNLFMSVKPITPGPLHSTTHLDKATQQIPHSAILGKEMCLLRQMRVLPFTRPARHHGHILALGCQGMTPK